MLKIIDMRNGGKSGLLEKLAARGRIGSEKVVRAVEEIVENVKKRSDEAVLEYTEKFDGVKLDVASLKVSRQEMENAYDEVDPEMVDVIKKSRANIIAFHEKQKENSWFDAGEDGVLLGQLLRPIETVGIYVPGGLAALTSSVLMNALPAKVAGVERIIMATPPGSNGKIDPAMLVAAQESGITEIYKIGGAQAVAAMAYGTGTVPAVDKIVGPGNIYVSTAKRLVYGICDIDMFAGPSEITVVADNTANPAYVAADLLSQAEHDELSASILVTPSEKLARAVVAEIGKQYERLSRKSILNKSLSGYGAAVIVNDIEEAINVVNRIAPEHLELCIEDAFSWLSYVKNAGAVFLGHWSPEPIGDYYAGPNHVLPTGGTARFFSPLNVGDFIKKTSVISYTRQAFLRAGKDVIRFAEYEKLDAHANAIKIRFDGE
ncbi:MAG: histidinol dehydrogenase [Acetivibrionales bacterium]|jgi:histidinol dehydrogenase